MFHKLFDAYTTFKQVSAARTAVSLMLLIPVIYILLRSSNESAASASFTATMQVLRSKDFMFLFVISRSKYSAKLPRRIKRDQEYRFPGPQPIKGLKILHQRLTWELYRPIQQNISNRKIQYYHKHIETNEPNSLELCWQDLHFRSPQLPHLF